MKDFEDLEGFEERKRTLRKRLKRRHKNQEKNNID